jgi:outer membrane receptor protein involved in Fe transport
MVYASASKGFRAGGAQASLPFCSLPTLPLNDITDVKSDTLWSYELGTKIQMPHPGLLLTAAAYHIDWTNPQQQVALPCGSYFEINGDKAEISGAEFELDGHLSRELQIRMGAGFEHTDFSQPGALSFVSPGIQPGIRIPGVPTWTASVGGIYTHELSVNTKGFVSADYSYTGNSISVLNGGGGDIATRPDYSLVNLRVGVDRGSSEVSVNVRNLTNAKPNLGDIGYVGYAQYNSGGYIIPQVATLPPLTVMLQYQKML